MAKSSKTAGQIKSGKGHKVLTEFRDIKDFNKIHAVGSDVSHFDSDRLEALVKSGYVSASDDKDEDEN